MRAQAMYFYGHKSTLQAVKLDNDLIQEEFLTTRPKP